MGSRTKVALNFGVLMRDPLRPDTRRSSPVRVPRHVLRHRTGVCCLLLPALAVGPRLAQVGPSVLPSLRSVPCAADRVESDSHQLIVHLFLHRLNLLSGAVLQVLCVCWHVCSLLLMSELYIFSASLSSGLSCYLFLFFPTAVSLALFF